MGAAPGGGGGGAAGGGGAVVGAALVGAALRPGAMSATKRMRNIAEGLARRKDEFDSMARRAARQATV